ncbi:N-acetylmuramoyl-L-alanine amidase, partial [Kingella kingae]
AELGNFVILRSLDMPSVLVEMGFLSNPQDEKLLASQDFRRQMANSIANAVQEYLRNVVLN